MATIDDNQRSAYRASMRRAQDVGALCAAPLTDSPSEGPFRVLTCREPATLMRAGWRYEGGSNSVDHLRTQACPWHWPLLLTDRREVGMRVDEGIAAVRTVGGWRSIDDDPPRLDAVHLMWDEWRPGFARQVEALGLPAVAPPWGWYRVPETCMRRPRDAWVELARWCLQYGMIMLHPHLSVQQVRDGVGEPSEVAYARGGNFTSLASLYTYTPTPASLGWAPSSAAPPPLDLPWDWIPGRRASVDFESGDVPNPTKVAFVHVPDP